MPVKKKPAKKKPAKAKKPAKRKVGKVGRSGGSLARVEAAYRSHADASAFAHEAHERFIKKVEAQARRDGFKVSFTGTWGNTIRMNKPGMPEVQVTVHDNWIAVDSYGHDQYARAVEDHLNNALGLHYRGHPMSRGRRGYAVGTPGHDDLEQPEPGQDFVVLKARRRLNSNGWVLLGKDATGHHYEYVTWISSDKFGRGERFWGHYYGRDYEKALDDYQHRGS